MEAALALTMASVLFVMDLSAAKLAARRRQRRGRAEHREKIRLTLELMQLLQKHRGLGSSHGPDSSIQRQHIAQRLDGLMQTKKVFPASLNADVRWEELRIAPQDFQAHCQFIEKLISEIYAWELRLMALGDSQAEGISQGCRDAEDLARLRGLAMRAASFPRCPLHFQIQMRYLCERISKCGGGAPLQKIIKRLDQELINADKVLLQPADCFDLITPVLDGQLRSLKNMSIETRTEESLLSERLP